MNPINDVPKELFACLKCNISQAESAFYTRTDLRHRRPGKHLKMPCKACHKLLRREKSPIVRDSRAPKPWRKKGIPLSPRRKLQNRSKDKEKISHRRDHLIEMAGGKCITCGYRRFSGALEFDHIDPMDKRFGLSGYSLLFKWEVVLAEFAKCQLLCANCHREKTYFAGENGPKKKPLGGSEAKLGPTP